MVYKVMVKISREFGGMSAYLTLFHATNKNKLKESKIEKKNTTMNSGTKKPH